MSFFYFWSFLHQHPPQISIISTLSQYITFIYYSSTLVSTFALFLYILIHIPHIIYFIMLTLVLLLNFPQSSLCWIKLIPSRFLRKAWRAQCSPSSCMPKTVYIFVDIWRTAWLDIEPFIFSFTEVSKSAAHYCLVLMLILRGTVNLITFPL